MAFVPGRRARIVDGHSNCGYASLFGLICRGCGDHRFPQYSEVRSRF
jgi:hypothetical protein